MNKTKRNLFLALFKTNPSTYMVKNINKPFYLKVRANPFQVEPFTPKVVKGYE